MLVIADDGRVLLLRYRGPDEAPQETVWLVPGGRAEGDETPAAAAARELWEEVGLVVDQAQLGDPVAVSSGCWTDDGSVLVEAVDTYFFLRVPRHEVDTTRLTGEERANVLGHRWWTADELAGAEDRVYPNGLPGLLKRLLAGDLPSPPLALPWQGDRERVRGCLLAGAVGDALGKPVEARTLDEIRQRYGPAGLTTMVSHLVTDNTRTALSTVQSVLRSTPADGIAAAPWGLLGYGAGRAFELAVERTRRTGGEAVAAASNGALAAIVDELMAGVGLATAVDVAAVLVEAFPGGEDTSEALAAAVRLAGRGDPSPEKVESLGAGWVAEEALAIAVYCALVAHNTAHGLLLAVNHSGASALTGSLCGSLLGAGRGMAEIPRRWAYRVEGQATISAVAAELADRRERREPSASG